ncbi:hypothetical protein CK497_05420 [Vreelandella alkaliphila]|uniref:diguanylate cyclase n=2 Tax=Vreelandella alkaliphila TaxID=272774 RepID=A0ABX4HJA0_9GAMM|nr:hypothetical protein CK497_05420 [Halomonas humidisoli]
MHEFVLFRLGSEAMFSFWSAMRNIKLLGSNAFLIMRNVFYLIPNQVFFVQVVEEDKFTTVIDLSKNNNLSCRIKCEDQYIDKLLSKSLSEEVVASCTQCIEKCTSVCYESPDKNIYEKNLTGGSQLILLPVYNGQGSLSYLLGIIYEKSFKNTVNELNKYIENEVARQVKERTAKLVATNEKLFYLANHDSLTGTYNRRYLLELANAEFKRVCRYGLSLCLMMLDLDHFKAINDNQGHPVGDKALKEVAKTLLEIVRDCDHVGRYGGDEFIIVLPETDISGAMLMAERLREALNSVKLTISIGIAKLERDDVCIETLINRADHLLLKAKRGGRDRIESVTVKHSA